MKWFEKKDITITEKEKIPWIDIKKELIDFDDQPSSIPKRLHSFLSKTEKNHKVSESTKIFDILPSSKESNDKIHNDNEFYIGFPIYTDPQNANSLNLQNDKNESDSIEELNIEFNYRLNTKSKENKKTFSYSMNISDSLNNENSLSSYNGESENFKEQTEKLESSINDNQNPLSEISIAQIEEELKPEPFSSEFRMNSFNENVLNENQTEEKNSKKPPSFSKKNSVLEERASITPIIELNNQYEIPFEILKIQKNKQFIRDNKETEKVIQKLEETLEQFKIEGKVVGIQYGPILTRYEIKLKPGIKVSQIHGLTDNIAMALEAISVRIEAPIPGRSTIGIEIPHKKRHRVTLGDLLNEMHLNESEMNLPVPIGKDIAGNIVAFDLAKMPHLLIAGATGSGKSVTVNAIITNFILNKGPDEIRFLLIDPKLVELSHYNTIPHLLHPVITDHQKAIQALNWAVEEMERRYEDLLEMKARDINIYNSKINTEIQKNGKMPFIIILIDELGDLMMVAGKEVQDSIIRLSQKARAVGIHLILATQRPSVDVITGIIKANFPARIALQVAQKTDSRTILDSNGAETLLGQGDLLFKHPAKPQLIRVQAPFVEDDEVEKVVHQVASYGKPSYIKLEDPKSNQSELDTEDEELFEKAWNIILEEQKASTSLVQRRLRIGYNRAARIIEALEARGFIGPQIGSKPREIYGISV